MVDEDLRRKIDLILGALADLMPYKHMTQDLIMEELRKGWMCEDSPPDAEEADDG